MIETQYDYQYEPPAVPLSLLAQVCEALEATKAERKQLEKQRDELQAQIDALMLEHCPDEMTPEQLQNWSNHQVSVEPTPSVTDLVTQENSKDF